VFAALAAAAFEDESPESLDVLRWLESQPPPQICAELLAQSPTGRVASNGQGPPKHFVPVNDTSLPHTRVLRREGRQPRVFPSITLGEPVVRLLWPNAEASPAQFAALSRLAGLVPYLGESASIVRLAWAQGADGPANFVPADDGGHMLRVPFKGQLQQFGENFRRGRNPAAGVQVAYRFSPAVSRLESPPIHSALSHETFVFRLERNPALPVTHALHLTAAVRQALVALAEKRGAPVPPVIHAHEQDGSRLRENHVVVAPLAHVRGVHASGRILGFLVMLPRRLPEATRQACIQAMASLHEVRFGSGNVFPVTRCAAAESRQTLQLRSWTGPARVWISVTPVVLNRFPGKRTDKSPAALVRSMCAHFGLPEPVDFAFRPESFAPGIPHAGNFVVRRPHWRPLPHGHLRLEFGGPVRGPIALGSCRHYGLGLMLPLPDEPPKTAAG
jgi:CRISPR-associated protein Csb2